MADNISTYTGKSKFSADAPKEVTGTDVTPDKRALDVQVLAGNITLSGLNIAGRLSQVTLSAGAWTALPAIPLADRNALSIQNSGGVEIKIGYDNAEPGYVGVKIAPDNERFYDVTENVIIYAKASAGTPTIQVEELS